MRQSRGKMPRMFLYWLTLDQRPAGERNQLVAFLDAAAEGVRFIKNAGNDHLRQVAVFAGAGNRGAERGVVGVDARPGDGRGNS